MKTVKEVIDYFEGLYANKAVYLWGSNAEPITWDLCMRLYKNYGNSTYNLEYYQNKFKEGNGRIGADCSGAMCPVSGFDSTAQGFYNKCLTKGNIGQIDRSKACLVFKGTTVDKIHHIGFYCGNGYVIEMKSSKDNCVKSPLDGGGWDFYGVPTWIDYTATNKPVYYGVDVSAYQGVIDFEKVKASGVSFVILRSILKNGNVDGFFDRYLAGAEGANLRIGVYHYSYDRDENEAAVSAARVVKLLNGQRLPIFLDLEDKEQLAAIGKAGITKVAKAYIKTCEANGYKCYIYCNLDWYKNYIDESLKPYAVWIARYGKNDGRMNNAYKPNVGEKIWQYSSKGYVPGISGDVDVDVCYDMALFGESEPITPTPPATDWTETSINVLGKVTAENSLNIRKQPTTDSQILGHYKGGDIVPLLALTSNSWYKTDKGYISGKYVKYLQGKVANCNALNVRKYSNTSAPVLKTIPRDTVFIIMNAQNDWFNILLADNTVGWVSGKYVVLL